MNVLELVTSRWEGSLTEQGMTCCNGSELEDCLCYRYLVEEVNRHTASILGSNIAGGAQSIAKPQH